MVTADIVLTPTCVMNYGPYIIIGFLFILNCMFVFSLNRRINENAKVKKDNIRLKKRIKKHGK